MIAEPNSGLSLAAALRWQLEIGVDEAVADEAVDWTQLLPRGRDSRPQTAAGRPAPLDTVRGTALAAPPAALAPIPIRGVEDARARAAAARSLPELRAAVEGFDGCSLKATAMSLVFGEGNPQARVMLVGEAPGEDEDRQGQPFAGPNGRLLDRMLAAIGLKRADTYLATILPWRPPGNRNPTPAEVALCQPFLERQISLVGPELLVLFGVATVKALLNRPEPFARLRGQWLEFRSEADLRAIPTLATYSPDHLLNAPLCKKDAWRDLVALKSKLPSMTVLSS